MPYAVVFKFTFSIHRNFSTSDVDTGVDPSTSLASGALVLVSLLKPGTQDMKPDEACSDGFCLETETVVDTSPSVLDIAFCSCSNQEI